MAVTDCAYEEAFAAYKNLQFVDIDNWGGIRLILKHLATSSYRKIAFVAGKEVSYDALIRESAYKSVMDELGLPVNPAWIMRGDYREDRAFEVTRNLLSSAADRPEAICCANDQMAFGVMGAIKAAGLSVPEDIAVTGFDDIRQSAYMAPSLTTINRGDMGMGKLIAGNLLRAIAGENLEHRLTLEVKLVTRDSSLRPRSN
jgi:DNA-binding LacI/PurR family transcriptional regulator